jgi:apolipoprotein N-acyltransferase
MVITLPLIWISYEFVLRHAWAILDGNGWYMAKIAYALVNRLTLIQIADIGGVYAVSLMIAAVNGAVFDCMFLRRQAITSAAIAFLVLATFMIYGTWRLSQSSGHAGPIAWLMPTEDMPTRKPPRLDGEESPNLMVWSENVLDKPIIEKDSDFDERWLESAPSGVVAHVDDDPQAVIDELSHFSKETGATLVVGAAHLAFRKTGAYAFNSAVCVHPTRGYEGCYDKIWLVPWVEAMPYHRIGLARGQSLGLTPGDHYPVFQTSTGHYFAVGICYDIMFPELFIDYMHESPRPEFFVICSSELTDRTLRLQRETYVCAQFRAIETRRAVIRSVRNGYSGMFDSNGTSVAKGDGLDILEPCSVGHVPIDSRWSLYSWAGDWLPMTTVAIAALISFRHRRRPQSA